MMIRSTLLICMTIVVAVVMSGCLFDFRTHNLPRNVPEFQTHNIFFERDNESIAKAYVEFAVTPAQRQRGLMFRQSLDDGNGMLFIFPNSSRWSFWMYNTYIPLSLAFINANRQITEFRDLYPHDRTSVVSTYNVRYALEVPRNWFTREDIRIGDHVSWEA